MICKIGKIPSYFKDGSNPVIVIEYCLILTPECNQDLYKLKELKSNNAFDECIYFVDRFIISKQMSEYILYFETNEEMLQFRLTWL
jgi:hypothetical protein